MSTALKLLLAAVAVCGFAGVSAFDFEVGGEHGWAVPPSNNTGVYNRWASSNRFRIGDNLVFKYRKDSVIVVTEKEYDHCDAEQPISFHNDGNTEVELDHAGTYYFISGLREHCNKGQKMIVRVLSQPPAAGRSGSPPPGGQADTAPPAGKSAALRTSAAPTSVQLLLIVFLAGSRLFFF